MSSTSRRGYAAIEQTAESNSSNDLCFQRLGQTSSYYPPNASYSRSVTAGEVYRPGEGTIIKIRADFSEEILAMNFARRHTSITIPRVLHYPHSSWKVWYLCMEEVRGVSLDKTLEAMTTEQLDHIASHLKWVITELRKVKPQAIGSVSGGPFRNGYFPCHPLLRPKYAFPT